MEGRLRVVGDSIAELDASRDSLLAQLAQVEALLTQAHAERADLEESRSVYEEGIAFSLDALQHQVMASRLPDCSTCRCQPLPLVENNPAHIKSAYFP